MKLLDTTVAIDYLRDVPAAVSLLERALDAGEPLVASEVVRFELVAGALEQESAQVEQFCSALDWAPVDEAVSRVAGRLAREHRRAHSGIDDADYLIAATALLYDAELLTTNVRHFPMLEGLSAPY